MVGDILRRERERQKLSIKDIEQGTSIRALYIESIEKGEYDKLPGNVYTKGFIKNYGNFLKLNGEELSHQFSEEVAPTPPPVSVDSQSSAVNESPKTETVSSNYEDETSKVVNEPLPEMNNQKRSEPEIKINSGGRNKENSSSGLLVAAIILVAAIAGGLWYYFTNIEGKEIAQNPPIEQEQSSTGSTSSASASTPDSASNVSNGLNLQLKFNDYCWTRITVDGRIVYEDTANPGQTLSWKANDNIYVMAGNAGAIEFIENGKSLGIAGAVGEVVEKNFVNK